CAGPQNRTGHTKIFLVVCLSFPKDRTISSPPFAKGAVGRWRRIIVGTHLLVSTPASAKATAGKPSKISLLAIRSLPAKDWLEIALLQHNVGD
ncbi:MAG TPA: hypothetical protein DEB07_03165, partial [Candidatus Moranbacteria bacterium]|nr:hypothetical protein [Candidatus Moranbacteria bacterium]